MEKIKKRDKRHKIRDIRYSIVVYKMNGSSSRSRDSKEKEFCGLGAALCRDSGCSWWARKGKVGEGGVGWKSW